MANQTDEVTRDFTFPAVWKSCVIDEYPARWRNLGSTPGPVKLAPGREFCVELKPAASDDDLAAVCALVARVRVREIQISSGGNITRAGLTRLAALPGAASVRAGCGYEADALGRHQWDLRLHFVRPKRSLLIQLKQWPADAVVEAVASIRNVERLEWYGRFHHGPFTIRPLFSLSGLRSLAFDGGYGDEYDWTGLARLTELRELKVEHGSYNAQFWKEVGGLNRLEKWCLDWIEKADARPGALKALGALRELAVEFQTELLGSVWKEVGRCRSVEKISVEHSTVDDEMAAGFGSLGEAETGYFWGVKLTDQGLRSLCRLRKLRSLVLCEDDSSPTPVSDMGFGEIRHLVNLETLELQGFDGVAPSGWEALRALDRLRTLKIFSRPPFDYLAVVGPLQTVEELEITHCNPVASAGWSVLEDMASLRSLSLYPWNWGPYHGPFAELSRVTQLRHLSLRDFVRMTDADLEGLTSLRRLEELSVAGAKRLTDAGLAHLKQFPKLRKLSLSYLPKLTDRGLSDVSSVPGLRELSVRCTNAVTDKGYAALLRARKLDKLELSYARNLTDERLWSIARSLPLRELAVYDSPLLTDEGVLRLARRPGLKRVLIISCRNVTDAGRAALREARPDWKG
jgi:hypothetical protein